MEKYSVLLPVYYKERAEYLQQAIQSMLNQTVPPDEFVVVCDGALTESLDAVIDAYEKESPELFRIVRLEKNGGISAALNTGLMNCSNELVARMDSDDIAVPQRMEWQLLEMEQHPEVSVLGGQIAEFSGRPDNIIGYRSVPLGESEVFEYAKIRNPMNHMTVLMRKSHVAQVGNYRRFPGPGFEDYYLWVNLLAHRKKLRNIDKVCCNVRAGDAMFARRGGLAYFQNCLKVEKLLLDTKLITGFQYIVNVIMWFGGTVLVPPKCRKSVFLRFLRKPAVNSSVETDHKMSKV